MWWNSLDTFFGKIGTPPSLYTDRLVHRPLGGRTVTFGTIKVSVEGEFFFEKLPLNMHENGLEMCNFFQSQWDFW